MSVIPCSTPILLEASFTDYPSVDTVTIFLGETVDIDLIYTTDLSQEECTHPLNWEFSGGGGGPQGFALEPAAAEATVYTKTFEPSSKGTHSVWGALQWSTENPPIPPITRLQSDNTLTVIVSPRKTEVDAELRGHTATAGAETRTADAKAEARDATAGLETKSPTATLETRTATAAAATLEASANVEPRSATSGLETVTACASVETRTATARMETRAVDSELPTRTVGGGVE